MSPRSLPTLVAVSILRECRRVAVTPAVQLTYKPAHLSGKFPRRSGWNFATRKGWRFTASGSLSRSSTGMITGYAATAMLLCDVPCGCSCVWAAPTHLTNPKEKNLFSSRYAKKVQLGN